MLSRDILTRKIIHNLLALFCVFFFIFVTSFQLAADELNNYQKLTNLIDRIVQQSPSETGTEGQSVEQAKLSRGAFPCWMLNADHRFAAPPPMIGLKVPGYDFAEKFVYRGLLTPERYASGTVAKLNLQNHNDAGYPKRYFFWAYDVPFDKESDDVLDQLDGDDKESRYLGKHALGLISFKVHLQREPYSESKHGTYPFLEYNNTHNRIESFRTSYPVKYSFKQQVSFDEIGGSIRPNTETVHMVAEEICYDPQPHLSTVDMSDMPWFKEALGENKNVFTYLPGEVPTALMHRLYYNYYQEKNIQKLNLIEAKAEAMLLALRIMYPVVNIGLLPRDYHICKEGGHHYCFASTAADAVGTTGALLRVAKPLSTLSRYFKAVNLSTEKVGNSLVYLSIAANAGLAGLYAQKEDYLNAGMRIGMTGIDLSPVIFRAVKRAFSSDAATSAPSIIGVKLGKVEEECSKVEDIVEGASTSHSTRVCVSSESMLSTASDPEFADAIQAANWQHPGLFEPIEELKVSRVDIRQPKVIAEAGGFFPNPKYRPGTAVEHVDFTHVQTSSFVSATIEQEDFGYFFRNGFFFDNARISYLDNAERDLLTRIYSAADIVDGPPAPIVYEIWVYKVTGKGVRAAKVNPLETVFGSDMNAAIGEQEALVRSIPLGQGHNLEGTRYQIQRHFYYVEDSANPGTYRLKLTSETDILDEDITKFETVLVPDEMTCTVANSAQPVAAPVTQHILHTGAGQTKCGNYNTATIFRGLKKVYKEPFSEWGDPVILANKYIGVSEAVGKLNNSSIKLITFEDGGLPGVYMCDYIEGQILYRSKMSLNFTQYKLQFDKTRAILKARLASIYPKTTIEVGGVSQEFFDIGDGYVLAVDEIFGENFIETVKGEIHWIDPYMIMHREKYIESKIRDLPDASKLEGTSEELTVCRPDQ